jgi:hypothetical protein
MAKKIFLNPNADLPPLMVLASFLNEKKREFVTTKLKEFGLVRQEFFNKKLGHKKKDFPFKKFLGKRYRYVTAPMTDPEVDQLFQLVQTLISITPKSQGGESQLTNLSAKVSKEEPKKIKKRFSLIAFLIGLLGLVSLGVGGFSLYSEVMEALSSNLPVLDLALSIGQSTITWVVPSFILFALAILLKEIKNKA